MWLTLLSDFVTSVLFMIAIAPSHCNENTIYAPEADANNSISRDWAELQVESSFDYCPESMFWTIMSGGSNNQVSHHLFPGIASTNLPKIVPILRETCKEFGVQYH